MSPNWGLDGPQPWLVAQLLQDPEQSERSLLAEYYRRYFREAAHPMQRFFERSEEQWMRQPGRSYWLKHYRNESQAEVFPSTVCHELKGLLDTALAQSKSDTVRRRVGQVSDAFGVTQRFVAMQEARDAVNRLALKRDTAPADALAALSRFLSLRTGFVTYTERLQREQPLLIAPFRKIDYLLHVDAFEREFAALVGSPHAAALASGTAALHLAMRLIGLKAGEEVMVSTLTFSASVNPILYEGGRPVFIDSERVSWNMDPQLLADALAARAKVGRLPKAVILVHLYGQSADIDPIQALCDQYGVVLIEDAAEALGASYKGIRKPQPPRLAQILRNQPRMNPWDQKPIAIDVVVKPEACG